MWKLLKQPYQSMVISNMVLWQRIGVIWDLINFKGNLVIIIRKEDDIAVEAWTGFFFFKITPIFKTILLVRMVSKLFRKLATQVSKTRVPQKKTKK